MGGGRKVLERKVRNKRSEGIPKTDLFHMGVQKVMVQKGNLLREALGGRCLEVLTVESGQR